MTPIVLARALHMVLSLLLCGCMLWRKAVRFYGRERRFRWHENENEDEDLSWGRIAMVLLSEW